MFSNQEKKRGKEMKSEVGFLYLCFLFSFLEAQVNREQIFSISKYRNIKFNVFVAMTPTKKKMGQM